MYRSAVITSASSSLYVCSVKGVAPRTVLTEILQKPADTPTLTQFLHFLNLGIHAIPPLFVIPPYKAFMRSRGQLKYADVAGLGGSGSGSHYESVTPGLDLTIDPYPVNYPAGLHDLRIKSFGNPLHNLYRGSSTHPIPPPHEEVITSSELLPRR